jgi:hypothetical protein
MQMFLRLEIAESGRYGPPIRIRVAHLPLNIGGRVYTMYFASGNGGQLVMISLSSIWSLTTTVAPMANRKTFFRWQAELEPRYIIPAAIQKSVP